MRLSYQTWENPVKDDEALPCVYSLLPILVAPPDGALRTMTEEEQIEELMDYALGLFLEQYAQSYIAEAKRVKRYNA